ncbi:MAG: uroporphyrinogen decarboxylase family protein [bacterium]
MQWLRGTEALMTDLMEEPRDLFALRDMVHECNMRELQIWLKYDFDAIVFSDDWGSQRQLLIPPRIWRDFFKPLYKEMFSEVKRGGKLVFFLENIEALLRAWREDAPQPLESE